MKNFCYELLFLVRQDTSQAQTKGIAESFESLIKNQGGSVAKSEYCGLLSTAYPVSKNKKAHYLLLNLTCSPEAKLELERQMKINEHVIRYLCLRVENHNLETSPLSQTKFYQEKLEQHSSTSPREDKQAEGKE